MHFDLIEVHNRASVVFDHTSYLENTEEFVAPVALEIAALAGMPVANLMKDDAQRCEDAKAHRRKLVSDKQLIGRLAALGLVIAVPLSFAVNPSSWVEAMTSAFTAWQNFGWRDWLPTVGRVPAVVYAALPVFVVVALFVIERILLHGELSCNADSLVTRRNSTRDWTSVAIRTVAYGLGAVALVWWVRQEQPGAAMAVMLQRLMD